MHISGARGTCFLLNVLIPHFVKTKTMTGVVACTLAVWILWHIHSGRIIHVIVPTPCTHSPRVLYHVHPIPQYQFLRNAILHAKLLHYWLRWVHLTKVLKYPSPRVLKTIFFLLILNINTWDGQLNLLCLFTVAHLPTVRCTCISLPNNELNWTVLQPWMKSWKMSIYWPVPQKGHV